jgi:hypothetical protein
MSFEELIGAIRAQDGDDPELAAATQLRVRRSLEGHAHRRHQLVGLLTAAAILFGGTVSWALATGQVATLWAPAPEPPESRPASVEVARPSSSAPLVRRAPETVPRLETVTLPEPVPPEIAPPVRAPVRPAATPRPRAPIAPPIAPPVEALYRRAHDLHFHGGDPAQALAAWDAYLAAEPAGRFSVDARYNRALLLVRLGRYADARAALEPFGRGAVEPAGYRQAEAEQLVERLAHYE